MRPLFVVSSEETDKTILMGSETDKTILMGSETDIKNNSNGQWNR